MNIRYKRLGLILILALLAFACSAAPTGSVSANGTIACGWNGTLENIQNNSSNGGKSADLVITIPAGNSDWSYLSYTESSVGGNGPAEQVIAVTFQTGAKEIVTLRYDTRKMKTCLNMGTSDWFNFENVWIKRQK